MPAAPTASVKRTPNAVARRLSRAVQWTLTLGVGALSTVGAQGAPPPLDPSPHSDIVLVSNVASVQPGQTVTVALRLTLDRGWHTYWINPGDAGLPLVAKWTLPIGVSAGALQFPTPHLTPQPPLMSYGYENEVLVLSNVQVPSTATIGSTLHIAGTADWLACADVCLPATGPLSLDLPVVATSSAAPTKYSDAISATRAQLPVTATGWQLRGWTTADGYTLTAVPPSGSTAILPMPYFFIDTANVLEHAQAQRVARSGDTLIFALPRAKIAPVKATILRGVIAGDVASASQRGWNIDVSLSATAPLALRKRAEALLADSGARAIGGAGEAAPVAEPDVAVPDPGADMSLVEIGRAHV